MQRFNSNGKLLLSGEYLILDGSIGLSLPTNAGQEMLVSSLTNKKGVLTWHSYDYQGNLWFKADYSFIGFKLIQCQGNKEVALTLQNILSAAKKANPEFLNSNEGVQVETHLQFPQDWGLGSSSTLINNIAQWSNTDAFQLLFDSFGGSGYDIASAKHDQPILYQLIDGAPKVEPVDFNPDFKDALYFVHLNKKQKSSESIRSYKKLEVGQHVIAHVSDLTKKILSSSSLIDFNTFLKEHESLLSDLLKVAPVQQRLFSDFEGQTKSLGAWGGDFILATGDESTKAYFSKKGFETVIPFTSMIKNS